MYERRSPDYTADVADVARRFPREWDLADKDKHGTRTQDFIRRLAWELSKKDANVGLNGKRGDRNNISADALAYRNETAPGGAEVIDVIVGSGHKPSWQDATIPPAPHPQSRPEVPEGVLGAYVQPTNPGGDEPVVVVPPVVVAPPDDARVVAVEKRLAAIEELLVHLVVTGSTGSRGSGFLSHYHELGRLPVVDGRTLPVTR